MPRYQAKSDVTGSVWKITSQVGDAVSADDSLMIIESMKMEIPLVSEVDGKVAEILVKEGEPVAEGQVLMVIDY